MLKKILCLILCLFFLAAAVLPAAAVTDPETEPEVEPAWVPSITIQISSAESLRSFAENCRLDSYSRNLQVILTVDIDLRYVPFESIPIFCGTFDGNGHTISGLSVTGEGSVSGLFRYLTDSAVVKNLHVAGNLRPQGSRDCVGSIAGQNAGTISNCSFSGTVSASDQVGGIAGVNTVTGIIEDCQVDGQIQGDHFIGGIVGENLGVIRNCTNSAPVNTTPQQNSVELSDITLESMRNSESANTVTDVGGIAGTSGGMIRGCENLADIGYRQMGYNIGGIAGSQMGYIVDCQNRGQISGRKEVGGIVGQMEPVANVVFTTDTLQILRQQLDTMGSLAGSASATVQSSASAITGQVSAMQQHANNAKEAVSVLLPGAGSSGQPDADQIQAAKSALSSSFTGMQKSTQSIASAAQDAASAISRDLQALTGQINAMGNTLSNASENIGGSVTDISDLDTPEDITGKIASCGNLGSVTADMNAGGIVGAIAPENDLDPDEDVEVSGEESMNFDSEVRAVVLSCENSASVTVSKRNGGGIAGRMALGLVKNSTNTGTVSGSDAEYVGGITGQSLGFVRQCNVKSVVDGKLHVGGIAGSATVLSDCRSVVRLSAREKMGAILGFAEDLTNITGNYYFTLETDPGAIDGISYDGCAQPLDTYDFLMLQGLPFGFKTFTVTFLFADGTTKVKTLTPGINLQESDIPTLPEKDGCTAVWEGLDSLTVTFDTTVRAVYSPYTTVLASNALQKDARPVILAEGTFAPGSAISLSDPDVQPPLQERQRLTELLEITLPESGQSATVRYLPPIDSQPDTLLHLDSSGTWQPLSYRIDGSYYVFETSVNTITLAAIQTAPFPWIWYAAAACVLIAGLLVFILIKKKHRK